MLEPQSRDVIVTQPISSKWAAAGWAALGLFFFCAGAWNSFRESNTGDGGIAIGTIALVLACLTYRGAPMVVSATIQKILLVLVLVFAVLNAIESFGRAPFFFGSFGIFAVFLLYVVLRTWRQPLSQTS